MGCFAYSCSVSRLPIECGDRVRFLAVSVSDDHRGIGINESWEPLTLPIQARYNDYGSVEGLEEGSSTEVFFETLNRLAVERAVGENEYHDVAVIRGMPPDEWLKALWENRVQVKGPALQVVAVAQAMIREDVWQFLARANDARLANIGRHELSNALSMETAIPRSVIMNNAHDSACRELVSVIHSLHRLGRPWDRGRDCGPQFGAWQFQLAFACELVGIARRKLDELDDEYDE